MPGTLKGKATSDGTYFSLNHIYTYRGWRLKSFEEFSICISGSTAHSLRGVLDEILNLIESVSEGFSSYSCSPEITEKLLKGHKIAIHPSIPRLIIR